MNIHKWILMKLKFSLSARHMTGCELKHMCTIYNYQLEGKNPKCEETWNHLHCLLVITYHFNQSFFLFNSKQIINANIPNLRHC